jgi:mono/diheme cytochrome c family protein
MLNLIRGALRVSVLLLAVSLVYSCVLLSIRPGAQAAAVPSDVASSAAPIPTPEQVGFFEKKIRPILSQSCYSCHSTGRGNSAHLHLDDRNAILAGGKSGPAIVPGNPAASLLIQRITSNDPDHRMPKDDDPLPANVVSDLRTWISDGAYWPVAGSTIPGARPAAVVSGPADQSEFFAKKVKPIFVEHCYACHSADTKPAAGLRVDTSLGLTTGGHSGSIFNVAKPDESLLLKRVSDPDPKHRMPKEGPALSPAEIETLREWIRDGAALPDETEKLPPMSAALQQKYEKLRHEHWAFQPITHPAIPAAKNTKWAEGNIDHFVLSSLEARGIAPVRDAAPEVLLRRLRFDLTGLEATPEEVAEFSKHHSERDYTALVDRLLESRQYAERWGRHWLDVARYGESTGPSRNVPYPHAWRYRDYVIDSVARDVPYDRFLREQIAGDLLPAETPAERDRLAIATGFLALGVKDVNQRFEARFQMDNVDEQIDTVTRSTMAMTASCARCHDHKFDPIPQRDYYALAGIFTSTASDAGVRSLMGGAGLAYYDPKHLLLLSSAPKPDKESEDLRHLDAEIEANRQAIDALQNSKTVLDQMTKEKIASLSRTGERLREQKLELDDPATLGYGIHGVTEGTPADTSIRVRGVEERHGPTTTRGFLTAFDVPGARPVNPHQSGRLELAKWIASPQNPLTARVAVNRIWAHLFGQGIVSSVDNFGSKGDLPANPELLDYLATDFIANSWSQRKLLREIVLSHAYRLSANSDPRGNEIDPSNQLVWRHSPRRLEAEELRDAVLLASGQLDETKPIGSPAMKLRMVEMGDSGPVAKSIYNDADRCNYRSIYLPAVRGITPRSIAAFDPVSQSFVTGQRNVTTVPTQALFLLNSNFVRKQAEAEAVLLVNASQNTDERIRLAYVRTLNRDPKASEIAQARQFLDRFREDWKGEKAAVPSEHPPAARSADYLEPEVIDGDNAKPPFEYGDMLEQNHLAFNDQAIHAATAEEAALASFVQALFASAEFQYIR